MKSTNMHSKPIKEMTIQELQEKFQQILKHNGSEKVIKGLEMVTPILKKKDLEFDWNNEEEEEDDDDKDDEDKDDEDDKNAKDELESEGIPNKYKWFFRKSKKLKVKEVKEDDKEEDDDGIILHQFTLNLGCGKKKEWFVKELSQNIDPAKKEFVLSKWKKELGFYSILLKDMQKFYKEKMENSWCEKPVYFYLKCYYYDDNLIIFKNMEKFCYEIEKERTSKPAQACAKMALKHVALLHAVTFELIEENGGYDAMVAKYPFLEETRSSGNDENLKSLFKTKLESAIELLKKHDVPGGKELTVRLESIKETAYYDFCKEFTKEKALSNLAVCVNHGECSYMNMFFLRDYEKKLVHQMIYDFQHIQIHSPTCDVLWYLFTSLPLEARREYWKDLVQYYYYQLKDFSRHLGKKVPYDNELLEKEFLENISIGFWSNFLFTPLENELGKLDKESVDEMEEKFMEDFRKLFNLPEDFLKDVKGDDDDEDSEDSSKGEKSGSDDSDEDEDKGEPKEWKPKKPWVNSGSSKDKKSTDDDSKGNKVKVDSKKENPSLSVEEESSEDLKVDEDSNKSVDEILNDYFKKVARKQEERKEKMKAVVAAHPDPDKDKFSEDFKKLLCIASENCDEMEKDGETTEEGKEGMSGEDIKKTLLCLVENYKDTVEKKQAELIVELWKEYDDMKAELVRQNQERIDEAIHYEKAMEEWRISRAEEIKKEQEEEEARKQQEEAEAKNQEDKADSKAKK